MGLVGRCLHGFLDAKSNLPSTAYLTISKPLLVLLNDKNSYQVTLYAFFTLVYANVFKRGLITKEVDDERSDDEGDDGEEEPSDKKED